MRQPVSVRADGQALTLLCVSRSVMVRAGVMMTVVVMALLAAARPALYLAMCRTEDGVYPGTRAQGGGATGCRIGLDHDDVVGRDPAVVALRPFTAYGAGELKDADRRHQACADHPMFVTTEFCSAAWFDMTRDFRLGHPRRCNHQSERAASQLLRWRQRLMLRP